jgi:hypothetical protein
MVLYYGILQDFVVRHVPRPSQRQFSRENVLFRHNRVGLVYWDQRPETLEQHDRVGCRNPPKIANDTKTEFDVHLRHLRTLKLKGIIILTVRSAFGVKGLIIKIFFKICFVDHIVK